MMMESSQQITSIHRLSPILFMSFHFIKSTVETFCHIGFLLGLAHIGHKTKRIFNFVK